HCTAVPPDASLQTTEANFGAGVPAEPAPVPRPCEHPIVRNECRALHACLWAASVQPMPKKERADLLGGQSWKARELATGDIIGYSGQPESLSEPVKILIDEAQPRCVGDREQYNAAFDAELVEAGEDRGRLVFAAQMAVGCRQRGKRQLILRIEPDRGLKV